VNINNTTANIYPLIGNGIDFEAVVKTLIKIGNKQANAGKDDDAGKTDYHVHPRNVDASDGSAHSKQHHQKTNAKQKHRKNEHFIAKVNFDFDIFVRS